MTAPRKRPGGAGAAIHLVVDLDRLVWDDMIMLEERGSNRQIRDLLARFMVDEAGKPMSEEDGQKAVGQMTLKQILATLKDFKRQMATLQSEAVTPEASAA